MEKRFVLRGALVGALGGFLAFLFARVFAEPQIQQAVDYESARDAAQDALDKAAGLPVAAGGPDVFSRTVQANVGIGVGMIFFGVAMGLLFSVVYTICLGRVGKIGPRTLSLLVAGGGFVGLYLVPFLKYPANPPAIGHEETIGTRSTLYLVMVGASVISLVAAGWLGQRLSRRFGAWNATLLAGAAFVVVIGVVMVLLPSLGSLSYNVAEYGKHATETPLPLTDPSGKIVFPGFPADVLSDFRVYSVLAQAILWSTIGLSFAPLAERLLVPREQRTPTATPTPVGVTV